MTAVSGKTPCPEYFHINSTSVKQMEDKTLIVSRGDNEGLGYYNQLTRNEPSSL